jgi:pyruvate kinase
MNIKIIATIGPASNDYFTLKAMAKAGMNIARLNTKYGSEKDFDLIIKYLKKLRVEVLFDIKGRDALKWVKKKDFDYLAVSFAESKKQIDSIRKELNKPKIKIISKIETKKGINHIEELIDASNGIMVARGDLGDNIILEELPIFQKLIIKKCIQKQKFVVTATEMLLSMTNNKEPTRAEVSDVANAVLDGSNALMLSEETTIGKHPVLAVKTMRKVIRKTEKNKNLLFLC